MEISHFSPHDTVFDILLIKIKKQKANNVFSFFERTLPAMKKMTHKSCAGKKVWSNFISITSDCSAVSVH